MFFVYILQSLGTGHFYVGQCDHLIERFREHQRGCTLATRNRGPWWMPYYEIYSTRHEALVREGEIKKKKSSASIRRIIGAGCPGIEPRWLARPEAHHAFGKVVTLQVKAAPTNLP